MWRTRTATSLVSGAARTQADKLFDARHGSAFSHDDLLAHRWRAALVNSAVGRLWDDMELVTACKNKKKRVEALRLIAGGADPNMGNRLGETPLHWAVINSDTELVSALLTAGADPNARTKSKHAAGQGAGNATPLHFAASRTNLDVIDLLLQAGSDPRAVDATGFSVLQAAVYSPESAILGRLVEAGADPNDGSLSLAVRDRGLEVVVELLRLGASPDGSGENYYSPLRMAKAFNKTETARVLLAAGAMDR